MPKLSQQTLEKRAKCTYCGKTFKGLQGLSGHIQFKHSKTAAIKEEKSNTEIMSEIKHYKTILEVAGYSEEDFKELIQVPSDWLAIKHWMSILDVEVNKSDYKSYLIMAYTQFLANRRLKQWLTKELGSSISQLMEINAKMMTNKLSEKLS